MIKFNCIYRSNNWNSYITRLVYFGSHYEMKVLGRCDISVVMGNTTSGYFIYFPYYETGFNIPNTHEIRENADKFMSVLEETDAVTVASAINTVSSMLGRGQKRCKRSQKSTKMIPY